MGDELGHERKTGTRGGGHRPLTCKETPEHRTDGCDLVFHLHELPAPLRQILGEILHDGRGRGNGVPEIQHQPRIQGSSRNRLIAGKEDFLLAFLWQILPDGGD